MGRELVSASEGIVNRRVKDRRCKPLPLAGDAVVTPPGATEGRCGLPVRSGRHSSAVVLVLE
jgi:hypothetical protein